MEVSLYLFCCIFQVQQSFTDNFSLSHELNLGHESNLSCWANLQLLCPTVIVADAFGFLQSESMKEGWKKSLGCNDSDLKCELMTLLKKAEVGQAGVIDRGSHYHNEKLLEERGSIIVSPLTEGDEDLGELHHSSTALFISSGASNTASSLSTLTRKSSKWRCSYRNNERQTNKVPLSFSVY